MPLFEKRDYYKPFEYPWAYNYAKTQDQMHWMEEEVPLAEDVNDFHHKLSPSNQLLVSNILKYFTQADCDVASGYIDHYMPLFKPVELRMMMAKFTAMEATHISAYSSLVDTLGLPEDTYQMFMQYKSMVDKHEYLSNFGTETLEDLAKTIAVFSALTEGVQLFSSFAILLNFQRHNLMKGMGQIVTWSIKDEALHVEAMTKVFRTLIEEHPELWTDSLKYAIYSAAERVIELEDAFIDTVYDNGATTPDLTSEQVKQHIRYIAGRRLQDLGLKNIFGVYETPLDWLEVLLNGIEHTNFFENRATEYARAATTGSWGDVFK